MKKKKTKKNRIVLIFCTILVCLCSVISFIPFKQEKLVVSADTVISDSVFVSSNFFVPFDRYRIYVNSTGGIGRSTVTNFNTWFGGSGVSVSYKNCLFKIKLFNDSDGNLMCTMPFDLTVNPSLEAGYYGYIAKNASTYTFSDSFKVFDYTGQVFFFGTDIIFDNDNPIPEGGHNVGALSAWLSCDTLFDYTRIDRVQINGGLNTSGSLYIVGIKYIDSNNYSFGFSFYSSDFDSLYDSRIYYLQPPNLTDNQYYQEGFSAGETNGYNNGYNVGQSEGYNEGYNLGQNVGYNNGYSAGSEDSNQYTFLNLVSATIDAPVKYFQSLFNFELLGVNLQGFLTGLFTLCVIVTIVKLCLGG